MNAAVLAIIVIVAFILGYRFYSSYLSRKIFHLDDDDSPTPAHEHQDDIDFVPTSPSILLGHHFASIAGAAPIVGPAVAVIWGWVPALLWVVLGTLFMGAAHDLGCLVVSMRHKASSMGQVANEVIGARVRNLFLVVIFFLVWLVIAVFALVIANLFINFPGSVLPVNFEIIVALLIGYFIHRKNRSLLIPAILAQIGLFVTIYLGTEYPLSLEGWFGDNQRMAWIVFLLLYSFIASVLPVWSLLQPRDYINSHQLFVGLSAMILGLFVVQPEMVAPALNPDPKGAPMWFPFLFITIACGAVSGFHGLVSSGTTSKQVARWKDARAIGYGGMLGEGLLALLATLAVSAGFSSLEGWHAHYGDWEAAKGLSSAINAFVMGSSRFLAGLQIPVEFGQTMISVLIISFAATSLDTAARIQRHVVAELGESWKIPILKNRFVSASIAIGTAFLLMLFESGGTGGLLLWPLFGATNQMLAALSLIVICTFLIRKGKAAHAFLWPMLFLLAVTFFGLIVNAYSFYQSGKLVLAVLSGILIVMEVWIVGEGLQVLRRARQTKKVIYQR